jgi:hypothetical protein
MADPKAPPPPVVQKGPSVGLVLMALVMSALAAGVVLWQIPLTACPTCTSPAAAPAPVPAEAAKSGGCPTCKSAGVTVDRFRDGTCPNCKAPAGAPAKAAEPVQSGPCVTCNGAGKISFVKKWGYDRIKVEVPKFDVLK